MSWPIGRKLAISLLALSLALAASAEASEQVRARRIDRSPVDLVIGLEAKWLMTVNQSSHTASLVDPAGKVLDEIDVGRHPVSAVCDAAGQRVFITCRD